MATAKEIIDIAETAEECILAGCFRLEPHIWLRMKKTGKCAEVVFIDLSSTDRQVFTPKPYGWYPAEEFEFAPKRRQK